MRLYSIATISHERALQSRNFSSSSKFLSQTFRQTGVRKQARLLREIYLLKIDPLSVVRCLVERIGMIISRTDQPVCVQARRGVAAASTIQLPRQAVRDENTCPGHYIGLIIQNPYGYLKKDQSRKKITLSTVESRFKISTCNSPQTFFATVPQTYCTKFFLNPKLFDLKKIVKLECLKTRCTCTKNQ